MGDKAQISGDVLSWIPKIILLVAVILVILGLVHMYVVTKIDTKDAEAAVLINRILFSPNGISYHDEELDRAYPGIIDLKRFNDYVINKSIALPENRIIAAKLTLSYINGTEIRTAFFDEDLYTKWSPMTRVRGPGGKTKIVKVISVLVKDGNVLKKATLKFEVIVPNA